MSRAFTPLPGYRRTGACVSGALVMRQEDLEGLFLALDAATRRT